MIKAMKVILLQNIQSLGNKYEVKEVADGYARNFLLPQGLAVIDNPSNAKIYEEKRRKEENQKIKINKGEIIKQSPQLILNFKEKTTTKGKLYGQISPQKLTEKLEKLYQLKLKPTDLIITKPLKEVGTYLVGIKPNFYDKIKVIIEKI